MSAPLAMIVGAVTVYLVYALYARRIDTNGIQSDLKHATPATLYMDGVGPTGGDSMTTLQLVVTRSLWLGVGAAAILAAGCAGMSNNNKGPIALSGTQEVPAVTTGASAARTSRSTRSSARPP